MTNKLETCKGCEKPIESTMVFDKSGVYHDHCFHVRKKKFEVKLHMTFADLVLSVTDYILESEEEDYNDNKTENHIYNHAQELRERFLDKRIEYNTTNWQEIVMREARND